LFVFNSYFSFVYLYYLSYIENTATAVLLLDRVKKLWWGTARGHTVWRHHTEIFTIVGTELSRCCRWLCLLY